MSATAVHFSMAFTRAAMLVLDGVAKARHMHVTHMCGLLFELLGASLEGLCGTMM